MNAMLREKTAQEGGEAGLVKFVSGDGDHGVVEGVGGGSSRVDAGQLQAKQRRTNASAFVAVDECLGFRDVKGVGGSDAEDIAAAVVMIILRLGNRAFEAGLVANTVASPMLVKRPAVHLEYHRKRKENDRRHDPSVLLCEAPKQIAVLLKDCVHGSRDIRIGRLDNSNTCFVPAAEFGSELLNIGQFGRRQVAHLFFDFGKRHGANVAHRELQTNLQFSR
jgi:hypothetical protein